MTFPARNVLPGTVRANIVGTCCLNGSRTVPPFFPQGASKLDVQHTPLNSSESRTTALKRLPSPPLNTISIPLHRLISKGLPIGVERTPTNPPELAVLTVPLHWPVPLSMIEKDTPPMTTSSRGAHWNIFSADGDEEEGDHTTSPG
eukprot:CAMPEP_0197438928 /NCGR_PEP_ID=MMETSP1175-20131217/5795_1 /TAXON_ID=1003142 /ORGANISM="Triceratium dubium, Strain CCMP147" /LENGTH=145 /DNA_ID=CAMNT_0042968749 /DNA_START=11 /DNA_END=445 /DNA_ORIENTATION=-